jgi:hypothetical protein
MVTHHIITFSVHERPSFAAVEREVQALSGLVVHYAPERMHLVCPALCRDVALYKEEGNTYCITTFVVEADYLLVTTIVALQRLGGTFDASLPPWAGQAWGALNKWAYRLRRNRIWYPYPDKALIP